MGEEDRPLQSWYFVDFVTISSFLKIKLRKAVPSGRKASIEPQTNAVESLIEAFEGFSLKETAGGNFILHECNLTMKRVTLQPPSQNSPENLEARYKRTHEWTIISDINYLENCVSVDEAGFNINMKSPFARAIAAKDVIALEIREPLKPKKIKIAGDRKKRASADKMSKFLEMKGFYIVVDNAHIRTLQNITTMIEARGYKKICFLLCSLEFNPTENFWSITKGAVK
ncbi:hypothetical protein A0J61_03262 [Choanephora cucurbitarum]|uniref:Tc1-like transposase DDE domain-containing protein n=1 Tax=Choanephora cucurbitarum TaxID=101091 RepID=A0A1C7NI47_9FUNG|nr:hypothetical protein A0J61_03262 [Choanephora cucurbitarum]